MAAIFAILLATAPAADAARRMKRPTYQQLKSKFVPMVFFVAKGDPNACGPGCDTWISAEGDFDEGAAARFRVFLGRISYRNLPVNFQSRGGLLGQALLIGDSLREFNLTASVGRTSPVDCRRKSKAACDSLKESTAELKSRLQTDALCASACVYAVVGGVKRKIAANASVRVHAPRDFGKTTEARRTQFYTVVNRYLARAGVTPDLMKLTMSVPNERIRTLTRNEIVKFGIERSDVLASWNLTGFADYRSALIKFERKGWSGDGTLQVELRLWCRNLDVEVGYYARGARDAVTKSNIQLTIDSHVVRFAPPDYPGETGEARSATLSRDAMHALRDARTITIGREAEPQSRSEVSLAGLDEAVHAFMQRCPLPFMKTAGLVPSE